MKTDWKLTNKLTWKPQIKILNLKIVTLKPDIIPEQECSQKTFSKHHMPWTTPWDWLGQHDVFGLEIAVDNIVFVEHEQRIQHLSDHLPCWDRRHSPKHVALQHLEEIQKQNLESVFFFWVHFFSPRQRTLSRDAFSRWTIRANEQCGACRPCRVFDWAGVMMRISSKLSKRRKGAYSKKDVLFYESLLIICLLVLYHFDCDVDIFFFVSTSNHLSIQNVTPASSLISHTCPKVPFPRNSNTT